MNKLALHSHDRGLERLNLSKQSIDAIQKAADKMYFSHGKYKLNNEHYYSKLKDDHSNNLGYAAFKRVGSRNNGRLILATILGKEMRPRGDDISHFFSLSIKDKVPTHPNQPKPYEKMLPIPNNSNN